MTIVWWTLRWFRHAPSMANPPHRLPARAAALAVGSLLAGTAVGGLLGAATLINQPDLPRTAHMTIVSAVEGAIAGLALALTTYSLTWRAADLRSGGRPGNAQQYGLSRRRGS
ncbi:hypothetical protein FHU30_007639 [Actinomadura rupiterrae]|nr:hypothetical protein [Actinomadura rupiterrae]